MKQTNLLTLKTTIMKKVIIFGLLLAVAFTGCDKSDEEPETDPQKIGIVGEWYSSGANVAPLLSYYFGVDSIYAKFEANNTYLVESFANNAKTTYVGTYSQNKSGVGTIWNITLNQSSPTAVTSVGIFDISTETNPFTMMYEVVQTEPSIGATPPTAQAGFGSTSNGAYGNTNIQKFIKIVK
jgi:hypothetical protein